MILCYELSDQQAHTLHQVKAHDVRAFAASKAFQSGVSLEQILEACHWKSTDGSIPDNRMMTFDHSPKGLDFKVYPGFRRHCHYSKMSSSSLVPSNLPAYQAVVIQLLSIG